MKIGKTGNQAITEALTTVGTDKAESKGIDFSGLLDDELQAGNNTPAGASSQTDPMAALGGFSWVPAEAQSSSGASASQANAVASSLDTLQSLGESLSNTSTSLKDVQGLLTQFSQDAKNAQDRTAALPEDHPLRQISNEMNVLSYVESVKWQRGDYA